MPSPRWAKLAGDLRAHRGRTWLAVLAMALGLAGAGTVLDAWALVRVATREGFLAADPPAATLRLDSVPPALLARVRRVLGVRDAEARRTLGVRATVDGTALSAVLFVPADSAWPAIGRPDPGGAAWPIADGTLLLERSSLDFSGAAVGGTIAIAGADGTPRPVRVAGLARDVTLAPGWMEHVVYAFTTRATLRALGLPDAPDELRIVTTDRTLDRDAVRRIAAAVRDTVVAAGREVLGIEVPEPGEHVHAAQMDSLLYTQGAFGLLALLLSAFLVLDLVTAMLAGQVREIGILKAIGARDGQVATLYLALAAGLGAASALIAVPVAMAAGRRYGALKAELLNFDLAGHALPGWVVAVQVVAAIALPLAAAAIPVRRACRISVAEALRDVGIAPVADPPGLLQRLPAARRPLLLSLRNAFRRRQRLALTLLALASAGAVFIGARNLRRAVLGSTDLVFSALAYDFSVRLAAPVEPAMVEAAVRGVPGVAEAEAWAGTSASLARPAPPASAAAPGDGASDAAFDEGFPLSAPPAATRLFAPRLVAGRWVARDAARELVASRALARRDPAVVVGAVLPLRVAGRTEPWTVVGIVDAGPAPSAYTSREALAPFVGTAVRSVVVRSTARGEAAELGLIGQVRAALAAGGVPVATTTRLAESRRVMEDHLLMVVDFLGAMGWLMLAVGGLGLGSTMAIAVLERTREIGVLRAIGARDRTVRGLVLTEALVIGALSWLLALPLSVPMSLALGAAFGRIMVPVPARWLPDAPAVLGWLALVLAVATLASLWPARRALRVPAARALSYE